MLNVCSLSLSVRVCGAGGDVLACVCAQSLLSYPNEARNAEPESQMEMCSRRATVIVEAEFGSCRMRPGGRRHSARQGHR